MLRYSEACLLSGVWLVVSGVGTVGYTFIGLSMLFAFFRYSIEFQRLSKEKEEKEEMIKAGADVLEGIAAQVGVLLSGAKRHDNNIH